MFSSALLAVFLAWQGAPPAPPSEVTARAYYLFIEGRILEGERDIAGAVKAYRSALDLSPASAEIRAELASLYARQNRAAEAVAEAEAALKIDPGNRLAHRILGFVQAAMAERPPPGTSPDALVAQAIVHFERTLSDGRLDPGVELALGAMYVQSKQFDKAITTLRAFLVSQPDYTEAMLLLAEAYEGAGRIADAVRQLEDVIREDPDQLRARAWLADLFERADRWSDAATAWGDLVKLGPRARSYRARYATALVNAGAVDAGRRELVAITRETPRDLSAWYLLAQVEQQSGNAEAAEAAARRIAEIDPEDARAALALSGARAVRGDLRGAAAALEARASAGREEDLASVIQDQLGDLYVQMKRYREAVTAFDRALAGDKEGIDVAAVTRKRDRARELAGK